MTCIFEKTRKFFNELMIVFFFHACDEKRISSIYSLFFFLLLITFAQIFSIGRKDKLSDWSLGRKEKSACAEGESERVKEE
jgi:hypothetical protein